MEVKEILETEKRNYKEEKIMINKFANIVKPYLSLDDVNNRLESNGFNGVYLLDSDKFSKIKGNENTIGVYKGDEKVVIIDESFYNGYKNCGIHEIGHAYLDGRNESIINVDGSNIAYGKGLEEGAMAILESTSSILKPSKKNIVSYTRQAKLFHQLDALYGYSDVREYENLLAHLLIKPEKFINLIRNIYQDIYTRQVPSFDSSMATKSAFAMVSGTDALIDFNVQKINDHLNYINSLYLNVADEDIRNGKRFNKMFIKSTDFEKTDEEKLIALLFGNDTIYSERQLKYLDIALRVVSEELEKLPKDNDNDKRKVLVRR